MPLTFLKPDNVQKFNSLRFLYIRCVNLYVVQISGFGVIVTTIVVACGGARRLRKECFSSYFRVYIDYLKQLLLYSFNITGVIHTVEHKTNSYLHVIFENV